MYWLVTLIAIIFVVSLLVRFKTSKSTASFRSEQHTDRILAYGNKLGRPRGLTWTECRPIGEFLTNPGSMTIYAPYEIQFAIIPGSDMEGIAAATVPRPVTVVFQWDGRAWQISRPPIFNLTPGDVLKKSMKGHGESGL